jgi:colicin import membrane protein
MRTVNPVLAGPILVEIAGLYAQIGERGTARDVLSQVMKMLPQIDDLVVKATMLAEAGGIYGAKTGGLADTVKARRALAEAATFTESIEERFRPQALAAVALGYVDAGLAKDAAEKVGALEELARSAADRPKAEGLAVAARVRAQAGDTDAAKALLDEAAAAAKGIVGQENRAYALVSVATATAAAGERKAALALLAEAEKSATKVGDAEAQKDALERVRAQRSEIERRK